MNDRPRKPAAFSLPTDAPAHETERAKPRAPAAFDDAVRLEGAMLDGGGHGWRFGEEPGNVFCVPVGDDEWASLALGPIAAIGGKTLTVRFRTETLPYLQMWRNQQAPANVLGIEPVSRARYWRLVPLPVS